MGKSIRSRREYKCNSCKSPIRKGDLYYKKSVTVGSPSKITIDNSTGYPAMVQHGYTFVDKICESCNQ